MKWLITFSVAVCETRKRESEFIGVGSKAGQALAPREAEGVNDAVTLRASTITTEKENTRMEFQETKLNTNTLYAEEQYNLRIENRRSNICYCLLLVLFNSILGQPSMIELLKLNVQPQ